MCPERGGLKPNVAGSASIEILRHVATIAAQKNARVVNVDATLLAEAPKISPHVRRCRKNCCRARHKIGRA